MLLLESLAITGFLESPEFHVSLFAEDQVVPPLVLFL
jgi:hypothetical protein